MPFIAAALDTIIAPNRLNEMADDATARDLPIARRPKDSMGHTLAVNDVLDEAIDWVATPRRPVLFLCM